MKPNKPPLINGVRYAPFEQAFDRQKEGESQWRQRLVCGAPTLPPDADEAQTMPLLPVEMPGHEVLCNGRPRKQKKDVAVKETLEES